MKTPSWEPSAGNLATFLANMATTGYDHQTPFADLFTFTTVAGTVLRYTSDSIPRTVNGNLFAVGPVINRQQIKVAVGMTVDSLDMTMSDDGTTLVGSVPLMQFIMGGGFVGARLVHERLFMDASGAFQGTTIEFSGRLSDIKGGRHEQTLRIDSDVTLLDVLIPRDVYQPTCRNTLYDKQCALSRASFQVSGSASGDINAARTVLPTTGLTQANGYFEQGVITMTSGACNGLTRTVKTFLHSTSVEVVYPFPFVIHSGDTFTIVPGCDKTNATCQSKFNNLGNFRAEPYIPPPITVT